MSVCPDWCEVCKAIATKDKSDLSYQKVMGELEAHSERQAAAMAKDFEDWVGKCMSEYSRSRVSA